MSSTKIRLARPARARHLAGESLMRAIPIVLIAAAFCVAHRPAAAQAHDRAGHRQATGSGPDTAFAALQKRGARVMGVDQYTSSHTFEALPDGGRIEFVRDVDDSAGVEAIREHLRTIARQFAA